MIIARSLLFNILMFGWTGVMCIGLLWSLALPKPKFLAVIRWYMRTLAYLERAILGLDYEVRGREHLPEGPCIIAAKHQSMWETMKLHLLFDDPAIILKRELMKVPIWGWYARKADLIPVDRGGRSRAIASIVEGAQRMAAQGRPVIIFPQGTRVPPGVDVPYRAGLSALYEEIKLPVVPMALNSGLFWGRRSFRKRPGRVVVEFLPPIPAGLHRDEMLDRLRATLEPAADRLSQEAGGPAALSEPSGVDHRSSCPHR